MNATIYKIILCAGLLAASLLVGGCTDPYAPDNAHKGNAPEGYFTFMPQFEVSKTQTVISRGKNNDDTLDKIDNVFVFIFTASTEPGATIEDAKLEYREYYEYGVTQSIYLKKGVRYYVYVIANLDESNIPDGKGNLHTFFDNVKTYKNLTEMYVQHRVLSPTELGKMIMTTDDPTKGENNGIKIIEYEGDEEGDGIFAPKVELYRLQAKFIVNIYNKVDNEGKVQSGVTPTSINAVNFPRKSYLVRRNYDFADSDDKNGTIGEASFGEFYSTQPTLLAAPIGFENFGDTRYNKRVVEFFCFENRRGNVRIEDFEEYAPKDIIDKDGKPIVILPGDVPDVYGRKDLAPNCASHLMLLSMTEGDVLQTFIHAGQGRLEEDPDKDKSSNDYKAPAEHDDIANYDVDRNCVYHFNVFINGVNDVKIDSRREFLSQKVLFYLPEDARVDAHYVDMPSYIKGKNAGIAKLQAGSVPESSCIKDANGEVVDFIFENKVPKGWVAFDEKTEDPENIWLRFSWANPYAPTRRSTRTTELGVDAEPTTSFFYVKMREEQAGGVVDGVSSATPILHFNEFVKKTNLGLNNYVEGDGIAPYPGTKAENPPRRIAAIRVGFVEQPMGQTLTTADYDKAEEKGEDYPFFRPVTQYGLKLIGQLGGWDMNEEMYTSMLGIESIEEHTVNHYAVANNNQDNNKLGGPWWWHMDGTNIDLNRPYNGKQATIDRYKEYLRLFPDDDKPPTRGAEAKEAAPPAGVPNPHPSGIYNPFSQTNAIDYCMRKNRDENGNGIIDDDEVKWYLPSPAQAMQMYAWRNMFRGEKYTLNEGGGVNYIPFGPYNSATGSVPSNYYWTTNAIDKDNALVIDFSSDLATNVISRPKTNRVAVRCVRDIEGSIGSMFYTAKDGNGNTVLVANLNGHFPEDGFLGKDKSDITNSHDLQGSTNNTIAPAFIISRWYVSTSGSNSGARHGNPLADRADTNGACSDYSEPGYPTGKWFRPSQRELLFIYGYTGLLDDILSHQYPAGPGPETYHKFITEEIGKQQPLHWAMSDIGQSSTYWWINFDTGAASVARHKNDAAYRRCIRYLSENEVKALQP